MRLAAVDLGSNTIQGLVADVARGRLVEVARCFETPALGAAVDGSGEIGADKGQEALLALGSVLAGVRATGAEAIAIGATAAVRQAADGEWFRARAEAVAGLPVFILSEAAEARLSFLGVASAHAGRGGWLMADVGGASTEAVAARQRRMGEWRSIPLGSGVLAARFLSDPPARGERRRAREEARARVRGAPGSGVGRLVATGGTVLHLSAVLGRELGDGLDQAGLARAAERLDRASAAEIGRRLELAVARVRALRGGVEILVALLEHAGAGRIELSREGLPHGMVLALAVRGDRWHLPE